MSLYVKIDMIFVISVKFYIETTFLHVKISKFDFFSIFAAKIENNIKIRYFDM
jgi:hypothetical protein